MANEKLKVKKGVKANLPEKEAGSLVVATDTQEMFLDISSSQRIRIGQGADSSSGTGIKEFIYDGAHSSTTNFVYNSLVSGTTIEVNDLLLLNFENTRIFMPNDVLGVLNNITCKANLLFTANKNSKILFRVVSITDNEASIKLLGEVLPPLLIPNTGGDVIQSSIESNNWSIKHKELLNIGTPGITYGSLVTETDFKKTIKFPEVSVDAYGHVINIQERSVNTNFRKDSLTDQTSAQYRNIVVVPSTTDLSTLDVPVGTIIFVKN